jgi:hypothetical protein
MALKIAANEADATYYALNELGFLTLPATYLVSDSILVGPPDYKELDRDEMVPDGILHQFGVSFQLQYFH